MSHQKSIDIVFEAILKEAVTANFRDRMNAMPSEEELAKEYVCSDLHEQKMKNIFAIERRRIVMRQLASFSKTAVIVLCASITLVFSLLLASPQVRAAVGDVLVRFFDRFMTVSLIGDTASTAEPKNYVPQYIPDGYTLTHAEPYGDSYLRIYGNEAGDLLMLNVSQLGDYAVDSEYHNHYTVAMNGIIYYVNEAVQGVEDSFVSWTHNELMFTLNGKASCDELLRISYSVEVSHD